MQLTINNKSGEDPVIVNIESTATVSELMSLLYPSRDELFENISLEEYQQNVVLELHSLYADTFKTTLELDKTLAHYGLNEFSSLELDYSDADKFLSNHYHSPCPSNRPKKVKTPFFWEKDIADSEKKETLEPAGVYLPTPK